MRKLRAIIRLMFAKKWILYTDGKSDWNVKVETTDAYTLSKNMLFAAQVGEEQQSALNEANNILNQSK